MTCECMENTTETNNCQGEIFRYESFLLAGETGAVAATPAIRVDGQKKQGGRSHPGKEEGAAVLLEPELEVNAGAVVEQDLVDIGATRNQPLGIHVEYPLQVGGRPAESNVVIGGFDGFVDVADEQPVDHLDQTEGADHASRSNRDSISVAYPEFGGHGALLFEDAGAVHIHGFQYLVTQRAEA